MDRKQTAQTKSGKPLESPRDTKGKQVPHATTPNGRPNATQSGTAREDQTNKEKQENKNPSSNADDKVAQNGAPKNENPDQSEASRHATMKSAEQNSLPEQGSTGAKRPGNGSRQQQNGTSVPGAYHAAGPNGHGHKQPRYDANDHSARPGESHFNQDHQAQAMMQMQRAAEASKQMLYGVYGNFISILEEYEARTHDAKAARSKIAIPDQSKKNLDDVQSIVQTQLLLFETQQRACPKAISQSVNKELRQRTLHWAAVREEHKMELSDTDRYICQLYEVLAKGKTKHEILDQPREPVSEETIRENIQHIFKGKHEAMEIDQEFKSDDKKKATSPETRRSGLDDAYTRGADRMTQAMPELVAVLEEDLKEFKGDGIEDTK